MEARLRAEIARREAADASDPRIKEARREQSPAPLTSVMIRVNGRGT